MKEFITQARTYAQYHQKKETFYTHLAGIPLIILGLMIFFGFFQLIVPGVLKTTLANIATLILLGYYFMLNWKLALFASPLLFLMLWISHIISYAGPTRFALWFLVVVLILGVLLQAIGHIIEGKKPAFMDNFTQAFIAPLFLVAEVCFMAGIMSGLKNQIHEPPQSTGILPPQE